MMTSNYLGWCALVLSGLALSSLGHAQTPTALGAAAERMEFFSSGGPQNNTTPDATGTPARLPDPTLFTSIPKQGEQDREHALGGQTTNPAPLPDPALFTQSPNLGEQHQEHAFQLFGKAANSPAPAAASSTGTATAAPAGTASTVTTTTTEASQLPDSDLFTQTPKLGEQDREHPLRLF